jgi:hypothetical protein
LVCFTFWKFNDGSISFTPGKEKIMLSGPIAEMVKGATGMSDAEVARLHSGMEKLFNQVPKIVQFQTVAEVVKSDNCFAQVKVGDKLIFDPFLNIQKSSGSMCPRALLPVMVQINALWEMASEWGDSGREKPPDIVFRHVRCLDPGLEEGGIGGVVYSIRMESKNP